MYLTHPGPNSGARSGARSLKPRALLAAMTLAASLSSVAATAGPAPAAGACVSYSYSYGGYATCVGRIQVLLNAFRPQIGSPYAKLSVDNSFGPATRTAVTAFQRFWRLTPDGIVGPRTWNILCSPQMGPGPISWYPYSTARAAGCAI